MGHTQGVKQSQCYIFLTLYPSIGLQWAHYNSYVTIVGTESLIIVTQACANEVPGREKSGNEGGIEPPDSGSSYNISRLKYLIRGGIIRVTGINYKEVA